MKNDEINAFLDAVDKANAGDENAFEGVNITLDGDMEASPAFGLENKKPERKSQYEKN